MVEKTTKSPMFYLDFILLKKKKISQSIKSQFLYYLARALSPDFNKISLVDWKQNENLISVTWIDRKINNFEVCDYIAIKKLWKIISNDNSLAKLIYNRKSEAKKTFSKLFLPQFKIVQTKIKFNPTCTKQKLVETMTTIPSLPTKTVAVNSPYLAAPKLMTIDTWRIFVDMGVLTTVSIIESFFEFSNPLEYKIVAESNKKVPKWLQVDNKTKKLVILTFSTNYDKTINYKGVWRGGLVASSNECDSKPLKIEIIASKNNDYYEKEAKYRAQMLFSTRKIHVSSSI